MRERRHGRSDYTWWRDRTAVVHARRAIRSGSKLIESLDIAQTPHSHKVGVSPPGDESRPRGVPPDPAGPT
jgi:hypothetical protein